MVVIGLCASWWWYAQGRDFFYNLRTVGTQTVIRDVTYKTEHFKQVFHALPGDFKNAGKFLNGCTGVEGRDCNPAPSSAGDGIIGKSIFTDNLLPEKFGRTTVPATSAADETILFWTHLYLTGAYSRLDESGIVNNSEIVFGDTNPTAPHGGGLVVGYWNGAPFPSSLVPMPNASLKGNVVAIVSDDVLAGLAKMNERGKQALTPSASAQIDRKMDDGLPLSGYLQAYGAPECFIKVDTPKPAWAKDDTYPWHYNESLHEKSCGLVAKISD